MKPIIAVTPLYDTDKNSLWMLPDYLKLVEANGGIPVILPLTAQTEILDHFIQSCDGFLFTGGHDVDPSFYGKTKDQTTISLIERDQMEGYCMKRLLTLDKPILAICRGLQLLNVVNGGTLYQDLPTERFSTINHQMKAPYDRKQHQVTIEKTSPLAAIYNKKTLNVNSRHHQAIQTLGDDLAIAATSEDGLIEGIYMPEKSFVVGLQWHPEAFRPATSENKKLMEAFFTACNQLKVKLCH